MASKRRTKGRRGTKKRKGKIPLLPLIFIFTAGILAGIALTLYYHRKTPQPAVETTSVPQTPKEIYGTPQEHQPPTIKIPPAPPPKPQHVVSIIIDDIGYKRGEVERFASIPYPIVLSIIPFTPFDTYSARYAVEAGKDVMLHIPMEPNHTSEAIERLEKRTKGMLLTSMDDKSVLELLEAELARVPTAIAANNHMGSKFTQNRHKMEVVLSFLKRHDLFFIDSRTSSNSKACIAGKRVGIVVIRRNIFLDNSKSTDYIKHQLDQLAQLALKRGYAVAIGHPHINTYRALMEKLPELEKMGVKVVSIRDIYRGILEGRYAGCL